MVIKYSVKFLSDWHCGSGLSAGADVSSLVIKDKDGFPYIPGKTIKGLLKRAMEELNCYDSIQENSKELSDFFGTSCKQGAAFFKNVTLDDDLKKYILKQLNSGKRIDLKKYLFKNIYSTAIDDNGIAVDGSLRGIEVVVPCELYGEIIDVPDELIGEIKNGFKFIKRLGLNSNRGMGRCIIKEVDNVKEDGNV